VVATEVAVAEEDAVKEEVADTVEAAAQEDMTAATDLEVVEVEDTTREEAVAVAIVDATTAARTGTWPGIAPARPREGAATNATKLDTSPGTAPLHLRSLIYPSSVQSVS